MPRGFELLVSLLADDPTRLRSDPDCSGFVGGGASCSRESGIRVNSDFERALVQYMAVASATILSLLSRAFLIGNTRVVSSLNKNALRHRFHLIATELTDVRMQEVVVADLSGRDGTRVVGKIITVSEMKPDWPS
jgi:hypothetical protein